MTSRVWLVVWSSSWSRSSLETSILATQRKLGRLIIDETPGLRQNVPRNRAGKCRNAAGARTVCAAAGARWEDRRQHSQPADREHHPVYSTPGVRP